MMMMMMTMTMVDVTWLSAILVGAAAGGCGCLALGYLLGSRRSPSSSPPLFLSPKAKAIAKDSGGAAGGSLPPNDSSNKNRLKQPLQVENLADILEDFKMVLVVRNDLKMGKGKIAAQCSHAALGLYKKLLHRAPKSLNRWEMCGQVKVVVKIESEDDMLVLQERAKSLNLPTHITIDAGRTQIAPNSRTVMAILGPDEMVDDVTGGLKLM